MLDKIITDMKHNRLSHNEEYNVEELLYSIKNHLRTNVDILQKSFEYEYKTQLDVDRLINSFDYIKDNKLGIVDSAFKNEYGKIAINYVPYGLVGVEINNNISLYNYASILNLLIQTNNSIIINPYKEMGTVNILIELLNQIITQINGVNPIVVNTTGELLQNNNLDLLLFIGDKNKYNKIQSMCEKKYFGIGNYELIIDKELDSNLIEEAKKRNVTIITKLNDDDFYPLFNYHNSNYCTAFMSDDKNEIRKFIANTKSSYLLVNALPTLQDDINITVDDLIYKKSTLIYED